jgi:hypothetical protein
MKILYGGIHLITLTLGIFLQRSIFFDRYADPFYTRQAPTALFYLGVS